MQFREGIPVTSDLDSKIHLDGETNEGFKNRANLYMLA